jgi:hypothetical protein
MTNHAHILLKSGPLGLLHIPFNSATSSVITRPVIPLTLGHLIQANPAT